MSGRKKRQGQRRDWKLSRWTLGVKVIILIHLAAWLVGVFVSGDKLQNALELNTAALVQKGEVWRLGSSLLYNPEWYQLLFVVIVLLWLGHEVERRWGTPKFLAYYFGGGVAAGLSVSLFAHPASTCGSLGALLAILAAYGVLLSRYRTLGVVPGRYAVWLIAGLLVVVWRLHDEAWAAPLFSMGGMGAAYLALALEPAVARKREALRRIQRRRARRRLKRMRRRVDAILAKISLYGQESLSFREKLVLKRASRTYRKDRISV